MLSWAHQTLVFSIVVTAIIFFAHSANGQVRFVPKCSLAEQSYLLNHCLLNFGVVHLADRMAMSSSRNCLRNKLNCGASGLAVKCINGIAANRLHDNCWDGLKETLSYMLIKHGFNCAFRDIEIKCWNQIDQLVSKSAAARRRTASGVQPQLPLVPPV